MEAPDYHRVVSTRGYKEFSQTYLRCAGIHVETTYLTNAVKCFPGENKRPSAELSNSCGEYHLRHELSLHDPDFVYLMGSIPCAIVSDEINLTVEHGIPRWGSIYDWEGWIIPMYSPGIGLRDTTMMIHLLGDFTRLGQWIKGEYTFPDGTAYLSDCTRVLLTDDTIREFRQRMFSNLTRFVAIDTETHNGKLWSIQCSTDGVHSYIILTDTLSLARYRVMESNLLTEFYAILQMHQMEGLPFIFHHAGADLSLIEQAGGFLVTNYRDTMQMAYHLGNLPQGLKDIAFRLFGLRMQSWSDLVTPYSREKALDWLCNALPCADVYLKQVEFQQLKTKVKKVVRNSHMETRLRGILRSASNNPAYNLWKRVAELETDPDYPRLLSLMHHQTIPQLGIDNVPLDKAIEYGCTDALVTARVYLEFPDLWKCPSLRISPLDQDTLITDTMGKK